MKGKQQGFTLIELVVVLVLLGIVGAAATARFQDMSTNAATVAVRGVAAELSSASAINYAAEVLNTGSGAVQLTVDTTCGATGGGDDPEDLFQSGAPPNGYTLAAAAVLDCATQGIGATISCTVTHTASGQTADASIICL